MTEEEKYLREWPLFHPPFEPDQNTDAEALDSAQEPANTNSTDSASVIEGGESVSAGESIGISGESCGTSAGNGAASAVGVGAGGAGAGASAGAAASGGVGM